VISGGGSAAARLGRAAQKAAAVTAAPRRRNSRRPMVPARWCMASPLLISCGRPWFFSVNGSAWSSDFLGAIVVRRADSTAATAVVYNEVSANRLHGFGRV